MTAKQTYIFVSQDRTPELRAVLKDAYDNPYDLSNKDVNFVMTEPDFTVKVNSACTIEHAANGIVVYEWGAADVNTPGEYLGEFHVTDKTSGKRRTFPSEDYIYITIRRSLY